MRTRILLGFLISVAVLLGVLIPARRANTQQNSSVDSSWSPNTERLDHHVEAYGEWGDLARDVKEFYNLLHRKEWPETYKRRTRSFRSSVLPAYYADTMEAESKKLRWQLLHYEILTVYRLDNNSTMIISRFVEGPGKMTSYRAGCWKKEDGQWRCDEAGPVRLSHFSRLSPFCCMDESAK